jgi:hypothetical protein
MPRLKSVVCVVLSLLVVACASAPPMTKEEKVRKLLRITGAEETSKLALDKMLDQFKAMPGMSPEFFEAFRAKADPKAMAELSVPVYVKHLDDRTLDAALAYYETEEGAKFAAAIPAVTSEAMDAGMEWGRKVAMEAAQEARNRPAQ